MDHAELRNRFTYHSPTGTQAERYQLIRELAFTLAERFDMFCPDSRELSLAMTHLEDAVMWANAAIARNEKSE